MTEHKIIKTDNYLLIVDDSEIKVGDDCLCDIPSNYFGVVTYNGAFAEHYYKKIIAHLPLNSPILDGVDLLPPLEDNEGIDLRPIEIKAKQHCKDNVFGEDRYYGYIDGYTQCIIDKEKYKFTEEDMRKAFDLLIENERLWDQFDSRIIKNKPKSVQDKVDEIIESLQQPKPPIGFKCEMEYKDMLGYWYIIDEITKESVKKFDLKTRVKTTTNLQGQTEWVGEYIY
jgi:hypothetical protein